MRYYDQTDKKQTHLLAVRKVLDRTALLDNLANKLVTASKARRNVQVAAVEVQIATTKCRSRDLENTIGIGLQLRIRLVFHRNLMGALVDDGSHRSRWLERRHLGWWNFGNVVLQLLVDLFR